MAVIECVFTYDQKKGTVSQEVHVLRLEDSDTLTFVTHQADLVLRAETHFDPMGLQRGDFAPVKYTPPVKARKKDTAKKFVVYYHGDQGSVACGRLVATPAATAAHATKTGPGSATSYEATTTPVSGTGNSVLQFQAWPDAIGQTVPDGGGG
jgi:hypothetical protein